MRKVICIVLVLAAIASFAGCSKKAGYKNNVSVESLASKIEAVFDSEGLTALDEGYINGSMQLDVSNVDEYVVKVNVYGTNIDEYGIFKAADEKQAGELKKALEDYLARSNESWMPEYMPEEYPKLKEAECKAYGNYVVYTILSDKAKDAVFSEIEAQLKA